MKNGNNGNNNNFMNDKFNRRKTREKDIMRFNNIQQKVHSVIPTMTFNNDNSPDPNFIIDDNNYNTVTTDYDSISLMEDIFKKSNVKTSVSIPLITDTKDYIREIPKILPKETLFATYLPVDEYDFNINKNINLNVEMDIYFSEKFYDHDVGVLRAKKVLHINNVYQENYKDDVKPTGFGDFIRGCYFLLQFCEKHSFYPHFYIHHPLAQFLHQFDKNYSTKKDLYKLLLNDVQMFVNNNWKDSVFDAQNYIIDVVKSKQTNNEFINYLCNLPVKHQHIFIYNNMFPYDTILEDHKQFVRKLLEPNSEMNIYVFENLGLIGLTKGKYSVIHIRSGDNYLNESSKIFENSYYKKIVVEVFMVLKRHPEANFLLIADNNEIKYLLLEHFPNLKVVYKDITHMGEGTVLERQKVKNTMLDFYLLANSDAIHSFTAYPHGSGFSFWCAKTYGIPYSCKYIK